MGDKKLLAVMLALSAFTTAGFILIVWTTPIRTVTDYICMALCAVIAVVLPAISTFLVWTDRV